MKTRYRIAGIAFALAALQGCAHEAVERSLDAKLAAEPTPSGRQELKAEATQLIDTVPGLQTEQRAKLCALRDSTDTQVEALRARSYQLRAVLVQDLLAQSYDDAEVELIKNKLRDIESQRLSLVFAAVERANEILGHATLENAQIMNDMFEPRGGRID